MGKISPVSAKYIVHTQINVDGVVDRPDVIGAIFGQTEGLLGNELELRELQRSGRIGRIEVNLDTKTGKSDGEIIMPSSLDKTETAIIGAALETIQRIGPCNAKVRVLKIEDVRISKRNYVIERAKELLKNLTTMVLPDSQEITDEVAHSVRMMEITEYGRDRLPAGPGIDESEEVIVVEGRADVLNLLKNGIKNCIAMNGTSVPETIIELSKKKVLTIFVDGDRGGDLIIRELSGVAEIDYVIKAPDGKEVEEITKKEIHKALRSKVAIEQVKMDLDKNGMKNGREKKVFSKKRIKIPEKESEKFKEMLNDLVGTKGAYILDKNSNILGKVPVSELINTVKGMNDVYAVIFDGLIEPEIIRVAEGAGLNYLIGRDTKMKIINSRISVLTGSDL